MKIAIAAVISALFIAPAMAQDAPTLQQQIDGVQGQINRLIGDMGNLLVRQDQMIKQQAAKIADDAKTAEAKPPAASFPHPATPPRSMPAPAPVAPVEK